MLRNTNYKYGPRDLKIPASLNYGEFLLNSIAQYKERTAFIDASTQEKITYGEILQNAINLAVSLTQLGVRKGDTIGVCSENRLEFWPAVVGSICAGAVMTPISVAFTKDEIKHVLSISKPTYIFCSRTAYQTHRTTFKTLKFIKNIILFGEENNSREFSEVLFYKDLISKDVRYEDFIPVEVKGQTDTMALLYSSGTTGLPKGVLLTHMSAVVSGNCLIGDGLQPEFVVISIAPWYHSYGMWGHLGGMCNGRTMLYINKFEEKLYLGTIQRYKPMSLSVVPPILVLLSKSQILDQYDVSSVFFIYCGAAPLDLDTINNAKKRFPNLQAVLQGYGMTESTLAVIGENINIPSSCKPGGVGKVLPGSVVKVLDLETRVPLGPNQKGEIWVSGPLLMKGYVGKDRKEDFDEEGFFKTGDIGYYDEDDVFFIVDRLKELIKYKGFQVPPAELEAVLLQHPAVRDAAVIGIPNKDAGEVPLAFIVTQPGKDVTDKEIKDYIASKLSNPKHLRGGVRFIEAIPKNPSGKILRRVLRDMIKSGQSKL